MSWVRVDDQFPDHPKLMRLGKDRLAGMGLWVVGLCYCARFLTDGYIPAMALPWGSKRIATLLVSVGLWDVEGDGYRVHDYDHYQPTRDKVLARRAENVMRQSRHRDSVTNAVTNALADASHTRTHTQARTEVPLNVSDWVDPTAFFEERTGRKPSQKVRDWLEDLHARFSRKELIHAMTMVPDPKATDWLRKVDAYLEAA